MIFLDSWVWIDFFIEQRSKQSQKILEHVREGQIAVISSFTLAEIKFHVAKRINSEAAKEFIHIIENFPNLHILPVTNEVAKMSADLRLKYYSKKTPISFGDAVRLATAVLKKCSTLYSGDKDFKNVQEIKCVMI